MRVKTGFNRRRAHNKVLNRTKGFRMTKGRLFKVSREADLHAGQYAFAGRKNRKRDMRALWIQKVGAALQPLDLSYSRFIKCLKTAKVEIDRKILADLVLTEPAVFQKIVESVQKSSK